MSIWCLLLLLQLYPLSPTIHTFKGNFMIFQNKILSGRVEQQCTMWGLPLWLHLHILQESGNTNEFISYFTELSRSTMAFPPCQPQVWQKTKIRKELKSTNVLGAWLNSSLSLTFTTPHSSSHSSTEVCVSAVQSSSHPSCFLPSCTGRRKRRGRRREARE